ncbi:hypothetical protein SAMN02746065_11449 [Desulfocicer vacuolatum DSM 3385]|uniref:Uncharacterized protein n=1 Tax=Desulfocicer vacuolatum DSM 3385 TaxID=1121400 RepID=A0A1W2CYJ5_9BACT|nr:hypothetical protein SAMN02746065_11449 [Desulfocicer vacuolatum DSM 3385]
MGPARNCRQLNWPVPIAPSGGLCRDKLEGGIVYKPPRAGRILLEIRPGVAESWWGQAFVIDIIEAFFAGKGLGR